MPDLNSVPPSPRVLAASRQSSSTNVAGIAAASISPHSNPPPTTAGPASGTHMPPPPVPTSPSSMHVFPSNQMAVSQGSNVSASALPSPFLPPPLSLASGGGALAQPGDGPGVGPGPGPLRHPRPLTAAELHMQLEKEQEAVVNRLTRELTLLRAQNASVVSNASSTSASGMSDAATGAAASGGGSMSAPSAPAPTDHSLFSGTSGFSIPSSTGRHNRTYSNTSTRSQTAAAGTTPSVVGITAPAPIRPTAPNLSRQNSTASRRSRANSPGPSSSVSHSYTHPSHMGDAAAAGYFQRAGASGPATPSVSEMSPAIVPGTARYDDTAFYRAELENVKRENEALRRRIRELERAAAASASGRPPPSSSSSQQQQPATSTPHHGHHGHHGGHHHHNNHHASNAQRERRERRSSDASRGRSESVSTTASMSVQTPGSMPAVSSSASLVALAGSGAATSAPAASSVSSPSAVSSTPVTGGGGGAGIAGRRESGRERVTSMLSVSGSVAGSVGVGVPEDEVRVGESAASAGLRGQDGGAGGNGSSN
ncbi:hypothetical protein SCUCBS95973_001856 [Sporothrix curviconia]|uniref:FAD dependent oxidoreductase n=1 Tax=Sporothrix curviconia TaxID=1260050 RepID=A0ABP0B254_9PEZI